MFIHYRTQGFILKKEDRGETDQLFTIYTKDFGKLEILVKGIRKTSSKLKSAIDIFYFSEIEFIQGKTHKTLTDAILIEKFSNLRKDLKKLKIAYKISEIFNNLIKGQEQDEKTWQLLFKVFYKLDHSPSTLHDLQLLYYYFLWNFLSVLGYKPELYFCSICREKLKPGKLYFSRDEGGVVCQNCFEKIKSGKTIEPETVKILRIILEKNWKLLSKLKVEERHFKIIKSISDDYLLYILEGMK